MSDFVESVRNGWINEFTAVTTYLALYNGDPQGAGTELTGGGYARIAITAAEWANAANGSLSNTAKKSFPQATANWNAGLAISHWAICTAGVIGVSNVIASDALAVAKSIMLGDTAEFGIGDIVMSIV